jgi:TatD DNase family protein
MPFLLDSHCHLDRYSDPANVADEAARRNVLTVAVTNLPSHFKLGQPHVKALPRVRLALGLHPLVKEVPEREFQLFEELLGETSYVGEIGVDLSREGRPTGEAQIARFERVLQLLSGKPKVLSLHSRGADKVVLDLLTAHGITGAIFHWYSGSLGVLERIVDAGHYFSVNPSMTTTVKGREIIHSIPPDRVLTETDGPHAKDGRRPLHPWDVVPAVQFMATVWGTSSDEVAKAICSNFDRLLEPARKSSPKGVPTQPRGPMSLEES